LGGAPLNLAAHAALQGCDAVMISAVGNDSLGKEAVKQIEALGVETACIATVEPQTGKCVVTLDENGVPKYNVLEDVAYDRIPFSSALPKECDVLAFGTLALRGEHNVSVLKKILGNIRFSEIYTDINIRPPFYSDESIIFCLSNATIVKISDEELPTVMRAVSAQSTDCESAAVMLSKRFPNIKLILITKGAKGSFCYNTKEKRFISAPAEPTQAVSTVGAGDSFGATFLVHYMKTGDIPYSLSLAAKVSAFVVSRKGAIPEDTKEFLEKIL
ncbi:MAG: hypothetical protein IJV70_06945, partial [Clostridia bacterium]|nr:hypothetical protein [Clostridia bacterium]